MNTLFCFHSPLKPHYNIKMLKATKSSRAKIKENVTRMERETYKQNVGNRKAVMDDLETRHGLQRGGRRLTDCPHRAPGIHGIGRTRNLSGGAVLVKRLY